MSQRYSWTQACCEQCWDQVNPGRVPVAIKPEHAELETCVHCGKQTAAGIYVRVDPSKAAYPSRVKDD